MLVGAGWTSVMQQRSSFVFSLTKIKVREVEKLLGGDEKVQLCMCKHSKFVDHLIQAKHKINGFSRFWSVPLHAKLKELRVKYGLKWLRIRMAYHCFPNLQSIFSADLGRKVMRGVSSEDCADADCNCQARFHIRDGQCIYGGKCNQHCTVYKATCRHCDKIYIGQTQTGLKKRFDGHFQVTRKQASGRDVASTTLSSHLTDHLHISHHPRRIGFHVDQIRPLIHVDIEWKGDTIAAMKSFRTRSCILCMKERWFIFKHRNSNIHSVLNQNLEVHKGCKHQTRFHRFVQDTGNPDP